MNINYIKKIFLNPANLFVVMVMSACVFYPIYDIPGSILFTSNFDCEIRLFNSDTVQIARDYYEVGKAPFIVHMKESGEYLLFAETVGVLLAPAKKTIKETITYRSGNIEYYIEF
jgi:hypothetical protein